MNLNLSYTTLEQKLQNIKYSLDNLCVILEQYQDPNERVEIETNRLDDISVVESQSSYHTALDSLSIASSISYLTAIDQTEFDKFTTDNKIDELKAQSTNTLMKKTVSFSKYVTILEVYNKSNKRFDRKDHMINFKGKFVDYIYREKFYIKYKWQKFKNNVLKAHKNGKIKTEKESKTVKHSFRTISTLDKEDQSKAIDLKWFFEDFFENSLLETDMDKNSITVVKECYAVPLTNFNTTNESVTCHSPLVEIRTKKATPCNIAPCDKIKIKPKLYNQCDSLQSSANSIENNLLLKYLISKAQYPIQLKIATSIVKLDLPLWYQSSLIV